MYKRLLVIIIGLIVLFASPEQIMAACSNPPNGCNTSCQCRIHSGIVEPHYGADPTTNPALPTNCSSLTDLIGYGVASRGTFSGNPYVDVTHNYGFRFVYCAAGTPITSTATGEIIIFAQSNYLQVTAPNQPTYQLYPATDQAEHPTGLMINTGQQFTINLGEYRYTDGPGWRAYDPNHSKPGIDTFVNNSRATAASKGYTIIAEQMWSDALTTSKYDSYDFEDLAVVVAIGNTAPTCADSSVNLSVLNNLDHILLSEPGTFLVTPINTSMYRFVRNTFNVAGFQLQSGCNPRYNNGNPVNCNIVNKGNSAKPTSVVWTHVFRNCEGSNCSPECTATTTFQVWPYPGLIRTDLGNTYIGNPSPAVQPRVDQIRYDAYYQANNNLYFSKFNFGTELPSLAQFKPSDPAKLSFKHHILLSYQDENHYANYYDRFAATIRGNQNITNRITINSSTTLTAANFNAYAASGVQLVDVTNNSNITIAAGVNCSSKTIFLISGSLTINPNFRITGDNGCLFLVRSNTTIPKTNAIDYIDAFILTTNFITPESDGRLIVKGGVIANNTQFNKNHNLYVTAAGSIVRTAASETLNFEGARYMRHFTQYLPNPFFLSIKEIQYIN
jgi:hypothetical protein